MEFILYTLRTIYRRFIWIVLITAFVTALIYWRASKIQGLYKVETTLYTGVISGYSIDSNNAGINYAMAQNAIDNLINIIQSESTLKRVSINLFAKVLSEGNPKKDQNGITSSAYNYTYNHLRNSPQGEKLVSLIVKNNQAKTVENFLNYEEASKENYIYGLFYYQHPYYSISALKKIIVYRLGNSDLLNVKYTSSDPCIAYNTIEILMKEFVEEYRSLRYGETDKVIEYFKSQLDNLGNQLTTEEDDLTEYNVQNRIINYIDETKEIAAINKEFELREQEVLFAYNSSKAMLQELEQQMQYNERQALVSIKLLDKLKRASELTGKISEIETISDVDSIASRSLNVYRKELEIARNELSDISQQYIGEKYNKNGLAKNSVIEQWLDQTLLYEKAKAELAIAQNSRNELNQKYEFYAPIGTTIKRKERIINFTEQSYLANLRSYNEALMRKKSLEMTSASLQVLNPPVYPISQESTNRKKIIMIACFGTFIFLIMLLILAEVLDRTLRDSIRARKLTKCPVVSSIPQTNVKGKYNSEYIEIATSNLCNILISLFKTKKSNEAFILNVIGFEKYVDKDNICNLLLNHWQNNGLKVSYISYDKDFNADSPQYILAQSITDLYTPTNEDIIIVNHPPMSSSNIPTALLNEASLNLLVASANYGWKSQDNLLMQKLQKQINSKPYICLTDAPKYDVENFTGMLPPYTFKNILTYRLTQLSFLENIRVANKNYKC